jgi:RND family efflux transporter MFP subunit
VVLLALAAGCAKPPPVAPPEPPVVTVEHPRKQTFDSTKEFTGYLRAVETQEVRAQVTGYLKVVKFEEGGLVKEGDVLYEIDPELYDATLQNAKANLTKSEFDVTTAKANLEQAKGDFDRAEKSKAALSTEEFDKRKNAFTSASAAVDSAKAAVEVARANIRRAEFDRKNCTIRSEVKGTARVSRTLWTKGNFVSAGTTVLCRVTSLDPIYAYFDIDENTSLEYRRKIYDTKELPNPREVKKLRCWVGLRDEPLSAAGRWPHEGVIDYIAPEIVRGTGAREIRGVLANPDGRLSPGDSVRVQVEAGPPREAVTVPEIAVGSQQQQKFVYVIVKDKDGKQVAEFRPVVLGDLREVGGVRHQVIEKGVTPDDWVVVNGLLRVRPGAEVTPKEQTPLGK